MGMTDWTTARHNMVESQIHTNDVTEPRLLAALRDVPREAFVPAELRAVAYIDEDLEIASGANGPRYLMEPMPFAKLVHAARIAPDDLVLDVGSGIGYSAAVIAALAGSVVALEEDETLSERAQVALAESSADNVAVVHGPLAEGYPSEAPYDVIVLEGAVEQVPPALFDQLAEGGRLVAILSGAPIGKAMIFVKTDGTVGDRVLFDASVGRLPGFAAGPAFVF